MYEACHDIKADQWNNIWIATDDKLVKMPVNNYENYIEYEGPDFDFKSSMSSSLIQIDDKEQVWFSGTVLSRLIPLS